MNLKNSVTKQSVVEYIFQKDNQPEKISHSFPLKVEIIIEIALNL